MIFVDGYDSAILGMDTEYQRVIYSKSKMIDVLIQDGLTELDAVKWLEYNVWNTYVGEHTPIFLHELTKEDIQEWVDRDEEII
jgi:hypothetical protein